MKVYVLENFEQSGAFTTFDKALASFMTTAESCNFKDISLKHPLFDDDLDICSMKICFKEQSGKEDYAFIHCYTVNRHYDID